jgi:putative component of toxin-antitoxin plasmid stabilization module
VLEVDFAYSGRIYYQKETKAKSNILAIGTKATQAQDLGYLEREYN